MKASTNLKAQHKSTSGSMKLHNHLAKKHKGLSSFFIFLQFHFLVTNEVFTKEQ